MISIFLISFIFLPLNSFSLCTTVTPLRTPESIVENLVNTSELVIKPGQKEEIVHAFQSFHAAPLKDLIPAVECIIKKLTTKETFYATKSSLTPSETIDATLLSVQKNHLVTYLENLYQYVAWWEKPLLFLYKKIISTAATVVKVVKPYTSSIEKLIFQLEWYFTFEREYLLTTYENALHFFAYQKTTPYPPLFSCWKDKASQLKILTLLYQYSTAITPQGELAAELTGAAAKDAAEDIIGSTFEIAAEEAAQQQVTEEGEKIAGDMEELLGEEGIETATSAATEETKEVGELSDKELDELDSMVKEAIPQTLGKSAEEFEESMETAEKEVEEINEEDGHVLDYYSNDPSLLSWLDELPEKYRPANLFGKTDPQDLLPSQRPLKLTGKARLQELAEQRAAKLDTLKATFKDAEKGFFTRAGAYLKYGYTKIKAPLSYISDRLDAYVGSKASNALTKRFGKKLDAIENNSIRRAIKELPPSWQGIADLLIQMEVMQAASLVAFWYEQDFEKTFAQWQNKQFEMTQLNDTFAALMTVQQKQNLTLANKKFQQNISAFSTIQKEQQNVCTFSQMWIEQAIFSSPPSSFFTAHATAIGNNNIPAMDDDIKFQWSSMITPETIKTGTFNSAAPDAWHNIYRNGNWQFMSLNNTFSQLQLVPLDHKDPTTTANQVLGNSIFRDYIPSQQLTYPISIECTLYSYHFPFFIGLLFNKGRWISGIPDRAQQTRFAGLYGTPDKKIYFVCEESKNSSTAEIKAGTPSTQSPFYRILHNPSLYTLTKNLVSTPSLPFTFTLQTTTYDMTHPTLASTITATLAIPPSSKASSSITMSNCSISNGLQHGIGFVSAGCVGAFTIQTPSEIAYNTNDLALMKKNLSTLVDTTAQGVHK